MKKEKVLETIIGIVAGFIVIYFLTKWEWTLYLVGVVSVLSVLSGKLAKSLAEGWMWLAEKIGWVSNRILLSVVYLLVLTPIALIYRLSRKSAKNKSTNWQVADQGFDKSFFEKPW